MLTALVVSNVRAYRDFLVRTIQQHAAGLQVISMPCGPPALAQIVANNPDLLVLDMRAAGSRETLRSAAMLTRTLRVVAFALDEDEDEVLACAAAGVRGYVTCEAAVEELAAAIDHVLNGELYLPPFVAASVYRLAMTTAAGDPPTEDVSLTARERQILTLLQQGLSNKEISARLHIEIATVKNHVHNVLTKLRVRSRAQAAAMA
jgi:two-component system nitrate/nitrite response regulator NarL